MRSTEAQIFLHFSRQAPRYREGRKNFLWDHVKRLETIAFRENLPASYPGVRVLEIGCGQGHYTEILHRAGFTTIHAIDGAPGMGADSALPEAVRFERTTLEAFETEDIFDAAVMMGVFEFLPDPEGALRKISEDLRSGGVIMFSAPRPGVFGFFYRLYYHLKGIRVRLWGKEELTHKVHGFFTDVEVTEAGPLTWIVRGRRA